MYTPNLQKNFYVVMGVCLAQVLAVLVMCIRIYGGRATTDLRDVVLRDSPVASVSLYEMLVTERSHW